MAEVAGRRATVNMTKRMFFSDKPDCSATGASNTKVLNEIDSYIEDNESSNEFNKGDGEVHNTLQKL